jgi:PAS domain S-box-containing protein
MKIQTRLLLLTTSMTVVAAAFALGISSYLTREALESAAKARLIAVLESRYNAMTRRLGAVRAELGILSQANTVVSNLPALSEGFAKLGRNAQTLLQHNYLPGHAKAAKRQAQILPASYAEGMSAADSYFQRHAQAYGWKDIFLVDPQGNVVYSVLKESDFATNLVAGPWKTSGLARAVVPLLRDAVPGALSFSDFSRYAPSNNEPAGFLAMPAFDEVKQIFLGVVAIQLRHDQLDRLMNETTGLGNTGEVFVVGKDGWMMSDSRFSNESSAFKRQIDTEMSRLVLSGKSGSQVALDYRGMEVLVTAKPYVPFPGAQGEQARWGVIAKIDQAEILEDFERLRQTLLVVGGILALAALLLGYWAARSITRPLLGIRDALARSVQGEIADVPGLDRRDEIGEMAKAAESFGRTTQQVAHDHWLAENVAALTNAVSTEETIEKAADRVLHLLCDQLQVPVGAIYLLENGLYRRVSAHGLARRSQSEDSFGPGDGLLGQCAKDGQAVVLSPVPSGLSVISTGLAEFPPHELVLYPLLHKNDVLAVLELAATKSIEPRQHEFLKSATGALGLHFANLQAAQHNAVLLIETRKQSLELSTTALYARSLLEASLDPLVTISAEGKVTDVNSATEQVTGVTRETLIGSDFADYFTEPVKAREGYQEVFSKGFVTDYPLAIHHASGRITDVLYNASVYRDADGKVLGVFAAARDITEKKLADAKMREQQDALLRSNEEMRALTEELRSQSEEMKAQNEELKANQEELRAQQDEVQHKNTALESQSRQLEEVIAEANRKADDLARANQYKSEFLANMSHELRTPLNSVLILSKNLAENEERNLTPDQVESATVISESGAQLLTLINDILDLSKIEAGKLEVHKEALALEDMVIYLRRVFTAQAEKKSIGFAIEIDPAVPATIFTDRQRLTQVLSNLLSNAIKFTDSGEVKLSIARSGDRLQLAVSDTGIGIPADKLEHIFGAFQQVDGSTSRKYGGSGLGLAISRQLAALLGGEIEVDSRPGRGSRFVISLLHAFSGTDETGAQQGRPRIGALQAPTAERAASPAQGADARILVVEDDPRLPIILSKMIKSLGFAPVCVESAELALASIAEEMPAGVFLDLGLPKMSGMELLRRLREDSATAPIPVFIMSGATDTGEAKSLGALGFLKKPVTRESISLSIKTMVGTHHHPEAPKLVLLVEDSQSDIALIEQLFAGDRVAIVAGRTGAQALHLLHTQHFDAVVLDLNLPDMSGSEWLKKACDKLNPPPVIVFSAQDLSEEAVFELKEIADSIVRKSASNQRLREEVLLALRREKAGEPAPIHTNTMGSGKTLLLVDDDARNLFALTKVLRARGYSIEVAPNGAAALEMLSRKNYDAILTDIMMPDIDGYELIRSIRKLGYGDVPVVAITAKAMQGDEDLCLQAGASAYLAKPVEIDRLTALLKALGV